ncbi:Lactose permease [Cytospora mali]|uniref:Lactose permease n=1 Tax=Cytospora mali TaxID=578113 RepID=A0A194UU54_CYTMA|nr:Lactose permease [Valsa mali var. pyri (nom. inval.)]
MGIQVTQNGQVLMGLVLLTAVFNGCTQGYDQSSMNNFNLISQYTEYFHLDDNLLGVNTAMINAGSVLGGLFAGQLCDKWGRRAGILASAILTFIAVAIQASATKEAAFIVGRILLGVSITINGCAAPSWVMEMAHPKNRALLGGLYMAIWYLAAIVVAGISLATYTIPSTWAWRGIAIGQVVPSLLAVCILPFTPESPRWLISQERYEEALQLLAVLHANGDEHNTLVQAEFKQICDVLGYEKQHKKNWMTLIVPKSNLRRFLIVIVLNVAAEVVGSNIVSFYLGIVFDNAGITSIRKQVLANLVLMVLSLFSAVGGSVAIEKLGRKAMLFSSSVAVSFFLALMAILSALYGDGSNESASWAYVAIIFLFLLSYSFAWTPLTFVYPIEILTYTQRAKGLAVGQMACYAFGFVNQYTTPIAINNIGWRYYAINAAWDAVICLIIWYWFVETKGLALEEVDQIFEGVVHSDGVFIGDGKNVTVGKYIEGMENTASYAVSKEAT